MATYPITTSGTQDTSTSGGMTNSAGTQVCRAQLVWTRTETETTVSYTVATYIYNTRYGYKANYQLSSSVTDGTTAYTASRQSCNLSAGGRSIVGEPHTYTVTKGTSSKSTTFNFSVSSSGQAVNGTSSGTWTDPVSPLDSYAVTYNANGGSGTISNQTKYYGQSLPLSGGSGFSRTNYSLIGWNTAAGGSGTAYALNGSYTSNAPLNLYAQWKQNYIKPTITNLKAYRVKSATNFTPDDDGTTIFYSFNYTGGSTDGETYITPTCVIKVDDAPKNSPTISSASGSVSTPVNGTYSADTAYTLSVQLYDSNDPVGITVTTTIPAAIYPIDLIAETNGTYMGVMTPAVSGQVLTMPKIYVGNGMVIDGLRDSIAASSSKAFTVTTGKYYRVVTASVPAALKGEYIVAVSTTGGVSSAPVRSATDLTVTTSTNTLTIANGNTSYAVAVRIEEI